MLLRLLQLNASEIFNLYVYSLEMPDLRSIAVLLLSHVLHLASFIVA